MKKKEIEEFAKQYLKDHGIETKPKHEKDRCRLSIQTNYGLVYVESDTEFFDRILYPGDKDYCWQAEGMPVDKFDFKTCFFVCNADKEIIVDITDITSRVSQQVILDKNNLLLPIENNDHSFNNHWQHFKIINKEVCLCYNFEEKNTDPKVSDELLNHKLIAYNGQLYNFEQRKFLGDKYDNIFLSINKFDLDDLASSWKMSNDDRKKFVQELANKMKQENLFGGYKHLEEEKTIHKAIDSKIKFSYDTFVFLNPNGETVSDVYYLDELEFKSIPFVNEEGVSAYDILKKQLEEKIENVLQENKEREKIYSKVMDKMIPTKNDKN